tara:strand:+ start:462 stop:830 length:369 start_codon:yes stop_codon:yes gene_type:complete
MALAMVSYSEGEFDQAGALFAQAMSMHDTEEFVDSLLIGDYSLSALGCSLSNGEQFDEVELSLESIAAQINIGSADFRRKFSSRSAFEDEDDETGFDSEDSDEDFSDEEDDYTSESSSPLSL